jgi:hypothetical protein
VIADNADPLLGQAMAPLALGVTATTHAKHWIIEELMPNNHVDVLTDGVVLGRTSEQREDTSNNLLRPTPVKTRGRHWSERMARKVHRERCDGAVDCVTRRLPTMADSGAGLGCAAGKTVETVSPGEGRGFNAPYNSAFY